MASSDEALHNLNSDVPDLLVLLLQQENDTGRLGVERAGNVKDRVLNNALDGIVRDRALGLQAVEGTTALNEVQQSGSSRVLEFGHGEMYGLLNDATIEKSQSDAGRKCEEMVGYL